MRVLIWLAAFACLFHATNGMAEVAKVTSGEHSGFSRLVVTLSENAEWRFGRTKDGYALEVDQKGLIYNLEKVFTRIPKTRIAAVTQVADSSTLLITVACACHAMPFEFRPGIIVVDLKPGKPSAHSSFEAMLDERPQRIAPPTEIVGPVRSTEMLRDTERALIEQIGRAASSGVIEMDLVQNSLKPQSDINLPQIRIGEDIGMIAQTAGAYLERAVIEDPRCLADEDLAVQDWGEEVSIARQIGIARENLLGEFDDPDLIQIEKAARLYIYIGFGQEARQIIQMDAAESEQTRIIKSLGKLVDSTVDPGGIFSGMENCDTAAALWSILARPSLRPSEKINTGAILLAFSALPLHLRLALVGSLGDRFLQQGDLEAARKVRDAVLRGPVLPQAEVLLLGAALEAHQGEQEKAKESYAEIAADGGQSEAEAVIALVELAVETGDTLPAETVANLEALTQQYRGAPQANELKRALVLGFAASGQFDRAFAALASAPEAEQDLWDVLAKKGASSAILTHAVLDPNRGRPNLLRRTELNLARRLLDLGLPEPAWLWLARPGADAPPEERILAAEIALRSRDAARALRALAGLEGVQAATLRGQSHRQIGESDLAAAIFADQGDAEASRAARRVAENWGVVATEDVAPWSDVAKLLSPEAALAPQEAPLAAGRALVEQSISARAWLEALLSQTAVP
ncbi:hypothetical protein Q9299_20615 [Gemmobacter fulvus]|uniref:hypothetical protein n=1 Tax=Gemmobacter fulvus TaxID=2840474 RepID=UPI002796BDEE|nr:hypothetical protein [Gemmobacter fulvus]MDQ1850711.1 hypothetical protein [Gemmobacter fulvus]